MSTWQKIKVKNIAQSMGDAPFGSMLKSVDYIDDGALVVQGKNIQGRNCDWSDRRYVSIEKWSSLRRSQCALGDIVFPKVGTIGKVGMLTPYADVSHYLLSTNTMRLRVNEDIADGKFIYYYFSSPLVSNLIQSLNSKSVQPVFNFTSLREFELFIPPLPIQREIAHILGSLDDKIDLNRRMNATLESMARALFKSWFVDFDPVRARAEGRQPDGIDADTAALFPDSFEDSALGPIPAGWRVGTLIEMVEVLSGGTPKTSVDAYWNGEIPWYSVKDVPNETDIFVIDTEKHVTQLGVKNSATKILPVHTTIISARGTVGKLAVTAVPMAMNQSCYGLRGKGYPDYFTFFGVRQTVAELQRNTHGTVFDTITRETFDQTYTVLPPPDIACAFENSVQGLLERIANNLYESRTLAATRDALLPRLMSGEVEM